MTEENYMNDTSEELGPGPDTNPMPEITPAPLFSESTENEGKSYDARAKEVVEAVKTGGPEEGFRTLFGPGVDAERLEKAGRRLNEIVADAKKSDKPWDDIKSDIGSTLSEFPEEARLGAFESMPLEEIAGFNRDDARRELFPDENFGEDREGNNEEQNIEQQMQDAREDLQGDRNEVNAVLEDEDSSEEQKIESIKSKIAKSLMVKDKVSNWLLEHPKASKSAKITGKILIYTVLVSVAFYVLSVAAITGAAKPPGK